MKRIFQICFVFCALQAHAQKVESVSAMRKVMMGEDLSVHLLWDTLAREHLFGISPLGRIEGEVTIIDGKIYTSKVDKRGKIVISQDWNAKAPFGVFAYVPEWEVFEVEFNVRSEADLQNEIENLAKSKGYDLNTAFPFRITGKFDTLDFHIISKPQNEKEHNHDLHDKAKKHFSLTDVQGEILGFYSRNHIGVFTHRGTFTHSHFIDEKRLNMGHIESVSTRHLMKVALPKRTAVLKDIRVNDTDFSKGRLGNIQSIDLQDLEKFHGHLCDGLVEGFLALQQGLYALYPDSLVDRTNTRIVSQPSPCLTDVAIYLTGGRYQFNTFYASKDVKGLYIVQRIDNGKTVSVARKPNVKPTIIDEMGNKAINGELSACELDTLKQHEDLYMDFLLKTNPKDIFEILEANDFLWKPDLKNDFLKTDILNKDKSKCN